MKQWSVLYIVESHYAFDVEAETREEAEEKAWKEIEMGTDHLDDISSDGGMLIIDEVEEFVPTHPNTFVVETIKDD